MGYGAHGCRKLLLRQGSREEGIRDWIGTKCTAWTEYETPAQNLRHNETRHTEINPQFFFQNLLRPINSWYITVAFVVQLTPKTEISHAIPLQAMRGLVCCAKSSYNFWNTKKFHHSITFWISTKRRMIRTRLPERESKADEENECFRFYNRCSSIWEGKSLWKGYCR